MKNTMTVITLASATTFGIFVFMAFLISNEQLGPIEISPPVNINVYQTPEDSKVKVIERVIFEPPTPPPTMPRNTISPMVTEANTDFSYQPIELKGNGNDTTTGTMRRLPDGDARPIFRMNPKYPMEAARNGIEGWVVLGFDINAIGEVINIKVINSEPKRIFDKAAKQALRKWKYKAKSIDGQQVHQKSLSVQLDFNIDQQI